MDAVSAASECTLVPTLQNVVCTIDLGCKLDLKKIAMSARNAEYNVKRFAAVIMRIREPKTTSLIFGSGKMVCTGAKSVELAKLAARKHARIVQKIGFDVQFKDFKIQNIVGSCDLKFSVLLEGLCFAYDKKQKTKNLGDATKSFGENHIQYEPEIFPGLIFRMAEPKVVILVFVSGKIVLTGAKETKDIFTAFSNIYPIISQFKRSSQISL